MGAGLDRGTGTSGGAVAGALATSDRGAGAGAAGRAGCIAGGGTAVARTSGVSTVAGAASASGAVGAGAASGTGIDAAGGAAGTGSVFCVCFTPAQPAAMEQESASNTHAARDIPAQSNTSLSGPATTDVAALKE